MQNDVTLPAWLTKGRIIAGAIVLGLFLFGSTVYSFFNSINNEGAAWESDLNAQYPSNQNYLSAFISEFYEKTHIANINRDALDKILTDAVKGRYDGKGSAVPNQPALFSAIAEAYPTIDLSVYKNVMETISAGRAGYRNKQDQLLDKLQKYDLWRRTDLIHRVFVSWLGYPSDDLKACIGKGDCVYGKTAEARMWDIVLAPQAIAAYQSGKMAPLTPPKD